MRWFSDVMETEHWLSFSFTTVKGCADCTKQTGERKKCSKQTMERERETPAEKLKRNTQSGHVCARNKRTRRMHSVRRKFKREARSTNQYFPHTEANKNR